MSAGPSQCRPVTADQGPEQVYIRPERPPLSFRRTRTPATEPWNGQCGSMAANQVGANASGHPIRVARCCTFLLHVGASSRTNMPLTCGFAVGVAGFEPTASSSRTFGTRVYQGQSGHGRAHAGRYESMPGRGVAVLPCCTAAKWRAAAAVLLGGAPALPGQSWSTACSTEPMPSGSSGRRSAAGADHSGPRGQYAASEERRGLSAVGGWGRLRSPGVEAPSPARGGTPGRRVRRGARRSL